MSQALKCYKHDSKIFNMAMIHIQGIWVWFYPIREAYQVWNTSGLCYRARTRKMSFNLPSDVLFHVTAIVCFQLIKSGIQKRQFSQIWFIHRLLNLPLFSKIFHPKKAVQLALEIKRKEIYWISSQSHMLYLASPKFSLKRSLFTRQ